MKTLIIGGGLHGVTIAMKLLEEHKVDKEDLMIMEPGPYVHQWQTITNKIEMGYLRSPIVHHVHPKPYDLKQYAKRNKVQNPFSGYYQRPNLEMFNQHTNEAIAAYGLEDCHIYDKAVSLEKDSGKYIVHGEKDVYYAERLIIAIGIAHMHRVPEFMDTVSSERYQHVFNVEHPLNDQDVIIGGGISACHTARKLAEHHHVTMIMRHDIRCHELDADPAWLGPKNLRKFAKLTDYKERRATLTETRNSGSMPLHLKQSLKYLESQGKLTIITGHVAKVDDTHIYLEDGITVPYTKIALATGCETDIKKDGFLRSIIETFNPPTADCGYPIVSRDLEWFDNVYVSGPLAELELGPMSRNIHGGRKASERIAEAIG